MLVVSTKKKLKKKIIRTRFSIQKNKKIFSLLPIIQLNVAAMASPISSFVIMEVAISVGTDLDFFYLLHSFVELQVASATKVDFKWNFNLLASY